MADFFDRYLKADGKPGPSSVRYEVLNGGGWRTSPSWPPPGAAIQRFYAVAAGVLDAQPPQRDGAEVYQVDFTASSGLFSRHQSPVDLSQTAYPDRAIADRSCSATPGAQLAADLVVAGNPEADLTVASTSTDGMGDRLPGRRAADRPRGVPDRRRAAPRRPQCRRPFRSELTRCTQLPQRRRNTDDARKGGKRSRIALLSPIAAVLRKGERIRIAIAGADADNLQRLPSAGSATLTVERGPAGFVVH